MKRIYNIPWDAICAELAGEADDALGSELKNWLGGNASRQELYDELSALWDEVRARGAAVGPDKERAWNELKKRTIDHERSRKNRKNLHAWIATAVAAASLVLVVLLYIPDRGGSHSAVTEQVYESMSGKSRITMPDGSEVWLHKNTKLAYGVEFGRENRTVTLDGEAFFTVAHDPGVPFKVCLDGNVEVKVYGTKFNVRSYGDSDIVHVGLQEGSVSITTGDGESFVRPGEIASYKRSTGELGIAAGDIFYEMLWASERLKIEDKSLGEICRYLEKWYNVEIVLDPALADAFSYSFTVHDEPLEEILRIMNRINAIDYRFVENQGVVISHGSIR